MTATKTYDPIKELLYLVKPRKGFVVEKYIIDGMREYRGKRQYVAGYTEARPYSHYASGLIYDRIVGWGKTQEEAIEMMRQRLVAKLKVAESKT